jgi:hypothetical protein
MSLYRGLLKFIQIFVVLVVLPRVASFLAQLGGNPNGFDIHDVIRFAFAATLGLGTIATAYFSEHVDPPEYDDEPSNPREAKRREREAVYFVTMNNAVPVARVAMLVFAFLDGTFNTADAFYGASQTGLLNPSNGYLAYLYASATFLFGISPTVLSIMLARVISSVDRIPHGFEKPAGRNQIDLLATILGNAGFRTYTRSAAANLLTSEDRTPEQPVRRTPNTEQRTVRQLPERVRNGEQNTDQRARIFEFLNSQQWEEMPSISTIQEGVGSPFPSRSTISEARRAWLEAANAAD